VNGQAALRIAEDHARRRQQGDDEWFHGGFPGAYAKTHMSSLSRVDGPHLPALDFFHHGVSALAEKADAEIPGFVLVCRDGGLAIVGKHFNEILVDKYPQGEVFAFFEIERRGYAPDS
jgi:hypothetical protein